MPAGGVTEVVDDETLNVLTDVSADELLEMLRSTEDPESLRRAAWTVPRIGGEEHHRALEARLADRLSQPAEHATEREPPTWCMAAVQVLAQGGGSGRRRTLLELAEGSRPLGRLAALCLAEVGAEAARPALRSIVRSPVAEVGERQYAASLLYTVYGDPGGLDEWREELSSSEEGPFSGALGAFSMVPAKRRGSEIVGKILEALRKQHDADHVVSLMFLLDGVTNEAAAVAATLRSLLADRRRAREVLADARAGRVRDFAAFYLARHLAAKEGGDRRGVPAFPRSFLARRRLRRKILRAPLAP